MRRRYVLLTLALLLAVRPALAQTGEGGLRGYVKDEQGGALPGATVTATSADSLAPVTAVADASGYYRLINLKPGTYTVSVELAGFAKASHPAVLIRAGNTFALDFSLKVGRLEEEVTVEHESPMLEIAKPSNVLNFDGEFQRHMPIASKRNWSDFLELTPGVLARPFDDGSGRMVYFGHGTEHFAHVIQLEGAIASNYFDAQVTYVGMGADMVQDIQVKTGGADASTPLGTGLAMNVVTKSGGNRFKGSVGYAYQPLEWNDNNASNCTPLKTPIGGGRSVVSCDPDAGGGTPTTSLVRQLDVAFGGPVKRDRVWFFAALRKAHSESGISRTPVEVRRINTFFPGKPLFNNYTDSWQPYLKLTARLSPRHELQTFYQRDRQTLSGDREYNYEPVLVQGTGGSLYGVKLQSIWGQSVTTTFTASYNDKSGNDGTTLEQTPGRGPQIRIHERATVQGIRAVGSGRILEGGNVQQLSLQPASQVIVRGDLTWFKEGWGGTHELQTGFFAAPNNRYDLETRYFNDGFVLEEQRLRNPNDPAAGLVPFRRVFQSPVSIKAREAHDRDVALYVQDSWRPSSRLTLNLGVRADWVRRYDGIFEIERQNSLELGPRLGFSYMVTRDAKNVLRGSFVRVHEQVMGRDAVTLFGADEVAETRNFYDLNGDGVLEPVPEVIPARSARLAASEFDPDLHQPFVDELILGFRKQFPWQISVDVAGIHRTYKDIYGLVDINGFWPEAPGQAFGGWGRVDPSRPRVDRQTNNDWSRLNYRAIEVTLAKNFSRGFQFVGGFNRQWQHYSGFWNPTDPARFLQPDAFASHKLLFMPRGNNEQNLPLVTGDNNRHYGPTWQEYSIRLGATWQAPKGFLVASSFTMWAGPWSGPVTDLMSATDPEVTRFGPARTSNGQANPLSTRLRFVRLDCASPPTAACFTTREEQVQAPAIKSLGLKVAKRFKLGHDRELEVAGNVFNLLNEGNYTQFNYSGAAEKFNPAFLQLRNQQPARAFQATAVLRF